MSDAPLTSTEDLHVGDVVQIAVQLRDKYDSSLYWWKRFAVVTQVFSLRRFEVLTLKMQVDLDRDLRTIRLSVRSDPRHQVGDKPEVVTKLAEPWPQGVVAMHMKLMVQGYFKLGEED